MLLPKPPCALLPNPRDCVELDALDDVSALASWRFFFTLACVDAAVLLAGVVAAVERLPLLAEVALLTVLPLGPDTVLLVLWEPGEAEVLLLTDVVLPCGPVTEAEEELPALICAKAGALITESMTARANTWVFLIGSTSLLLSAIDSIRLYGFLRWKLGVCQVAKMLPVFTGDIEICAQVMSFELPGEAIFLMSAWWA